MIVNRINKAVILAAGLGSRLKPLTNTAPKCLTLIDGESITQHTLDILEKNGIKETIILIGYLGNMIVKEIGFQYRKMKISYLWNHIYNKTNTMYSLWLAKKYLEQGIILIEGDTLFEEALISGVLAREKEKTFWIVEQFTRKHEGSMEIVNQDERIIELQMVYEQLVEYRDNYFKSAGILKITSEYGKKLSKWLKQDVENGNINIYYDLVIAKHLSDSPIYIHDITDLKWAQLDNLNDLKRMEQIFK